MRDTTGSRYMGTQDAAKYLGCTTRALYHKVRACVIPHVRLGSRLIFDRVAIDECLASATGAPLEGASRRDKPARSNEPR